jgi:hypothetical protein
MKVPFFRAAALVVTALSAAVASSCAPVNSHDRISPQISAAISASDAISRTNARTAYGVVEQLRPTFLRPPIGSDVEPIVYLDGMLIGGVAELRSIQASSVRQVQFLSAMEAAGRYGRPGRLASVILLTSRRYRL